MWTRANARAPAYHYAVVSHVRFDLTYCTHDIGVALAWISLYLTGSRQSVWHAGMQSAQEYIKFGVPQGPVLGPLLFVLYTADLVPLIADHSLSSHLYADRFMADPHRPMPARSKSTCRTASMTLRGGRAATGSSWTHRRQSSFGALLHAVAITFQMETYKSAKTQFIRCSQPETSVSTSTAPWHITHVLSSCYSALRQIRSIMPSLSSHALNALVTTVNE